MSRTDFEVIVSCNSNDIHLLIKVAAATDWVSLCPALAYQIKPVIVSNSRQSSGNEGIDFSFDTSQSMRILNSWPW